MLEDCSNTAALQTSVDWGHDEARTGGTARVLRWYLMVVHHGVFIFLVVGWCKLDTRTCPQYTEKRCKVSVVGAGGATTKCSPRPRHPAQVLQGRRPPRVSPARGDPWQPRPTAGGRLGGQPRRRRGATAGQDVGESWQARGVGVKTRNGFTRAAGPMPGHRYWRDANRDGRKGRTGESEPARGARAGRAAGVRGRGGGAVRRAGAA